MRPNTLQDNDDVLSGNLAFRNTWSDVLEYPLSERVFRNTANCTARILIEHCRHFPEIPYTHPLQ